MYLKKKGATINLTKKEAYLFKNRYYYQLYATILCTVARKQLLLITVNAFQVIVNFPRKVAYWFGTPCLDFSKWYCVVSRQLYEVFGIFFHILVLFAFF